jgi:aryl-alcohol dehydrogenase-like predicted oxidoreductase
MNFRTFGKTGWQISDISLGTWQVGGGWGKPFSERNALEIIHAAIDMGVNFIDTADVYDSGLSEAAVGKAVRQRKEKVYLATKCGRRISPHTSEGYTPDTLKKHVEDSLRNTGLETLDLVQLHCPPSEVYQRPEVFGLFETLRAEGKIQAIGVSVERVDEALQAMSYPVVSSIQIIFNMFRQKPAESLFKHPEISNFGIIARVPLASGLLSGKYAVDTLFGPQDHRTFNRNGEAFDKGETFSGVPYDLALEAVEALKQIFKGDITLAHWALCWILEFPQVSTVIPGASNLQQLTSNIQAAKLPKIPVHAMFEVKRVYDLLLRDLIHPQW